MTHQEEISMIQRAMRETNNTRLVNFGNGIKFLSRRIDKNFIP
jgi:hypothetical protein